MSEQTQFDEQLYRMPSAEELRQRAEEESARLMQQHADVQTQWLDAAVADQRSEEEMARIEYHNKIENPETDLERVNAITTVTREVMAARHDYLAGHINLN